MNVLSKIKELLDTKEPETKEDKFYFNRNKKVLASTTMPTEVDIKKELAEKSEDEPKPII